jgi:preprotein translocase subunit SecD
VPGNERPTTPREENTADATVVLPEFDDDGNVLLRYELGPATVLGDAIEDAEADAPDLAAGRSDWAVQLVLKSGETGIDAFNQMAALCHAQTPDCPTGQLAIELDGVVVSAPAVQVATFERDQISITGAFTSREAKDLATALRYGSLPVSLELQTTQTVSATLGEDALDAGIIAGLLGVALVTILMVGYYRWFGALAIAGLFVSAAMLWSVIAWLGESRGLALTLAGVTGLIVSIGVQLDSCIVYFEHMKEAVWNGRTPRSAVDRAFKGAWGTIKKGNFASLIGAVVLYFLAIGAVKGFALYLIIGNVLDLLTTYFFVAPAARIMARASSVNSHPKRFGLPTPVGAE